jgi:ABC-type branched-subunit amino acid transport system ATPase component
MVEQDADLARSSLPIGYAMQNGRIVLAGNARYSRPAIACRT